MYARYEKSIDGKETIYKFIDEEHLFGCNIGIIPKMLKRIMDKGQSEPWCWHIPIELGLLGQGYNKQTLIVDIKPNSNDDLTICEIIDIWGYSSYNWSPIMMRMRVLFSEADPLSHNKKYFLRSESNDGSINYSFSYAYGSVQDGNLKGKWTPPIRTSMNSLLLWPDCMKYFLSCMKEKSPDLFCHI